MDPICEKCSYFFAFPLRSHMSNTMNGGEVQSFLVSDNIAGNLAINIPGSPLLTDCEFKAINPSSCSISWDSTIGITGEEENSVIILHQYLVDPK